MIIELLLQSSLTEASTSYYRPSSPASTEESESSAVEQERALLIDDITAAIKDTDAQSNAIANKFSEHKGIKGIQSNVAKVLTQFKDNVLKKLQERVADVDVSDEANAANDLDYYQQILDRTTGEVKAFSDFVNTRIFNDDTGKLNADMLENKEKQADLARYLELYVDMTLGLYNIENFTVENFAQIDAINQKFDVVREKMAAITRAEATGRAAIEAERERLLERAYEAREAGAKDIAVREALERAENIAINKTLLAAAAQRALKEQKKLEGIAERRVRFEPGIAGGEARKKPPVAPLEARTPPAETAASSVPALIPPEASTTNVPSGITAPPTGPISLGGGIPERPPAFAPPFQTSPFSPRYEAPFELGRGAFSPTGAARGTPPVFSPIGSGTPRSASPPIGAETPTQTPPPLPSPQKPAWPSTTPSPIPEPRTAPSPAPEAGMRPESSELTGAGASRMHSEQRTEPTSAFTSLTKGTDAPSKIVKSESPVSEVEEEGEGEAKAGPSSTKAELETQRSAKAAPPAAPQRAETPGGGEAAPATVYPGGQGAAKFEEPVEAETQTGSLTPTYETRELRTLPEAAMTAAQGFQRGYSDLPVRTFPSYSLQSATGYREGYLPFTTTPHRSGERPATYTKQAVGPFGGYGGFGGEPSYRQPTTLIQKSQFEREQVLGKLAPHGYPAGAPQSSSLPSHLAQLEENMRNLEKIRRESELGTAHYGQGPCYAGSCSTSIPLRMLGEGGGQPQQQMQRTPVKQSSESGRNSPETVGEEIARVERLIAESERQRGAGEPIRKASERRDTEKYELQQPAVEKHSPEKIKKAFENLEMSNERLRKQLEQMQSAQSPHTPVDILPLASTLSPNQPLYERGYRLENIPPMRSREQYSGMHPSAYTREWHQGEPLTVMGQLEHMGTFGPQSPSSQSSASSMSLTSTPEPEEHVGSVGVQSQPENTPQFTQESPSAQSPALSFETKSPAAEAVETPSELQSPASQPKTARRSGPGKAGEQKPDVIKKAGLIPPAGPGGRTPASSPSFARPQRMGLAQQTVEQPEMKVEPEYVGPKGAVKHEESSSRGLSPVITPVSERAQSSTRPMLTLEGGGYPQSPRGVLTPTLRSGVRAASTPRSPSPAKRSVSETGARSASTSTPLSRRSPEKSSVSGTGARSASTSTLRSGSAAQRSVSGAKKPATQWVQNEGGVWEKKE